MNDVTLGMIQRAGVVAGSIATRTSDVDTSGLARTVQQIAEALTDEHPTAAAPSLGSVERLTQELAAAHARNADLQEHVERSQELRQGYLDTLTTIRELLKGTTVWDGTENTVSMVERLTREHRDLIASSDTRQRIVEEQGERIRNALDALTPPF